jgi:hypothetical protein
MTNLLKIALGWVQAGFSVIPILYHDKRPDTRLVPEWKEFQTRLPSNTELAIWFPGRLHNIALVTGWNNLVVVDFDVQDAFEAWHYLYPIDTYMVKTRRGMHVYFKVTQPVPNYHGDFLDIKSAGGYVLIPPSVHPSGWEYSVWRGSPILEIEKLSDVLPAELMPVREYTNPIMAPPPNTEQDPWKSAENAIEIDDHIIQTIREKKSLLDFFPGAVKTSSDGRWWIALCQWHDDRTPSLWIDTTRKICGCYACGFKPMDVINLVSRLYGLTNLDALHYLAREA